MTPVFLAPIILPDSISQTSEKFCSALIVSFTALLYLAMTLTPFLRESDTKPAEPESPDDTFDQGEEK
ncbi:MAG: hypothetical protein ACRD4X_10785 [Candidatus Acidiferrales bacterium]